MNNLDFTVLALTSNIKRAAESYKGEPGTVTINHVFPTKPDFDNRTLLKKVKKHFPKYGFETIQGIVKCMDIYVLEWKVYL
jgi:hypothetical protein